MPAAALCAHLASDELRELAIPEECVLEAFHGPALALPRCRDCGRPALLELVDASPERASRLYSLAGLEPRDAELFLRNTRHGSCDLARRARELQALLACAGPRERLLAIDPATRQVLRAAARPAGLLLPTGPWRERRLGAREARAFDGGAPET